MDTPHRDSVKKVPVFIRLRETCRLKILQVNDLAAESSQKRTYESLWRRVASPRLKSAIEGRKPNRSTGQFPAPDECSLRRNALSVLCALGGKYHAKPVWFCFCFEMKGLGPVETELSLTGIMLSQISATPGTWTCRRGPFEERNPSTSTGQTVRSVRCAPPLNLRCFWVTAGLTGTHPV